MIKKLQSALIFGFSLICGALVCRAAEIAATKPISFKEEIAPVLVSKCLGCHGTERPRGRYQLHTFEKLMTAGASKSPSIVPGHPEKSELFRLITSNDPDERMPPKGERLSAAEIETLRRWIAAGAEWPVHWAYRPLVKPAVPAERGGQGDARNPIDRFVLAKLEQKGL